MLQHWGCTLRWKHFWHCWRALASYPCWRWWLEAHLRRWISWAVDSSSATHVRFSLLEGSICCFFTRARGSLSRGMRPRVCLLCIFLNFAIKWMHRFDRGWGFVRHYQKKNDMLCTRHTKKGIFFFWFWEFGDWAGKKVRPKCLAIWRMVRHLGCNKNGCVHLFNAEAEVSFHIWKKKWYAIYKTYKGISQ